MCPSQTPEKSGAPSGVLGTACVAAVFASAFGEVCAHNPDEKMRAATRARIWLPQNLFISRNPPVLRIDSSRPERAARLKQGRKAMLLRDSQKPSRPITGRAPEAGPEELLRRWPRRFSGDSELSSRFWKERRSR